MYICKYLVINRSFVDHKCGVEYYEWVEPDPGIIADGEVKDPSEGFYMVTSSTVEERHLLHFNWGWDGDCDGYFAIGVYAANNAEQYDDPYGWNHYDDNYDYQVKFLLDVHTR